MNLKERNMILRVYQALNAVPGANIGGGMKTTTVSGVVNFGADIQEVLKHCTNAMEALFDGHLDTDERDADFNDAMSKAEKFIATRSAVDWRAR